MPSIIYNKLYYTPRQKICQVHYTILCIFTYNKPHINVFPNYSRIKSVVILHIPISVILAFLYKFTDKVLYFQILYCIMKMYQFITALPSQERKNKMKISEIKALICDDSILVRKKLTDILKSAGITAIYEATNGIQAVEQYKEHTPDITFMDIVMPEKTGLEALEDIKKINPDAKVVMASTIGTQSNLTAAIKAGAFDFLQKPVQDEDIYKILNTFTKE